MIVKAGSTDVTTYFVLRLAASGVEATGLTITNFDLQYTRSGVVPTAKVDATALAATDSAHGDNQAIEIDATDQPGLYRVDWPDAAFASGVREVILTVKCATAFTEHLRVEIVGYNPADGVRLGLTALPNAAADAAGGLPISDAGGLDLDGELNGIQADTEDIQSRLPAALTGDGNIKADALRISGDATAADNVELFFDGTGYDATNSTVGAVTLVNGLGANVITAASAAADFGTEIGVAAAVAVTTTAMTEAYAADGAAFTLAQAIYMIWSLLAERSIAGTTLTAKKLNGSTTAMTFTLDDATTPTSQTRAS